MPNSAPKSLFAQVEQKQPWQITDVDDLRRYLHYALELELSTIPPYLCALYSIPDGSNVMAATLIRSVVMEEMLHMVLVANLLNAVGGTPDLLRKELVPDYPTALPMITATFTVSLLPFGTEAIETFMRIERPARRKAPSEPGVYHSIGELYDEILEATRSLEKEARARKKGPKTIFTGDPARQVTGATWYYGGGGEPIEVNDLKSAKRAIEEVMEQGEGFDDSIFDGDEQFEQVDELAHYYRFYEIRKSRRFRETDVPGQEPTGALLPVDWAAAHPMTPNPKAADFRDQPEVHRMMMEFNRTYMALLASLNGAFNGEQARLQDAVPIMYEMKYQATALMQVPSGRNDGLTVGPGFEFLEPGDR